MEKAPVKKTAISLEKKPKAPAKKTAISLQKKEAVKVKAVTVVTADEESLHTIYHRAHEEYAAWEKAELKKYLALTR